jgi:CheY-like chemotaxis protein
MTKLRILVADDAMGSADSLAMFLRMREHEVEVAYDGAQAIARAEVFRPEVALLDLDMPKMSGYDACRHIREQAWGEGILIVAITGWGDPGARSRASEAGFDAHLTKPADPRRLMELLASPRQ